MHVKQKNLKNAITIFKFEIVILQNKYVSNPISPVYILNKYANAYSPDI